MQNKKSPSNTPRYTASPSAATPQLEIRVLLEDRYKLLQSEYKNQDALSKKFFPELKWAWGEYYKFISIPFTPFQSKVYIVMKNGFRNQILQEALRKAVPCSWETFENIQLEADLDASEFILWESMGCVLKMQTYQSPQFGVRSQKEKKSPEKAAKKSTSVHLLSRWKNSSASDRIRQAELGWEQGVAINEARDWIERPHNLMTPADILKRAKSPRSKFLSIAELKKRKAGAFLAVVQADHSRPAGILHQIFPAKTKKPKVRIGIVGKGLCFDTGGYNIKTARHMYDMHRDMSGAAIAANAARYLSIKYPDFEFHSFLALAENLISADAYKPNDVVVASNGLSIEVIDTDAEGRMVLSDTLVYASEQKLDLIVDFATLTGAVIGSIGNTRSGVFSNQENLLQMAVESGRRSGEEVVPFPIGDEYVRGLESDIADVRQCSSLPYSDHIYAATFLSRFVSEGTPWVHVDLASESNKGGLGLSSKHITGFGVRWLDHFVEGFGRRFFK